MEGLLRFVLKIFKPEYQNSQGNSKASTLKPEFPGYQVLGPMQGIYSISRSIALKASKTKPGESSGTEGNMRWKQGVDLIIGVESLGFRADARKLGALVLGVSYNKDE